jgi:transposase
VGAETVRSIAEALQISPSCVTKCKNLRRETGGVSPGKIGGHKKPVLSGTNADWLRKRIRSGPFTLASTNCAIRCFRQAKAIVQSIASTTLPFA